MKTDIFACHNCRRRLFVPNNAITHERNSLSLEVLRQQSKSRLQRCSYVNCLSLQEWDCKYIFVEPMAWMKNVAPETGKIFCPSCGFTLGYLSCVILIRSFISITVSLTISIRWMELEWSCLFMFYQDQARFQNQQSDACESEQVWPSDTGFLNPPLFVKKKHLEGRI